MRLDPRVGGSPTPRRAPVENPIRAELFGIERLEQHAESLAAAQRVTGGAQPGRPLLARVEDNGRALRAANTAIAAAIQGKHWITPAAEWLVDNFFVVDEQLREIRDDLPVAFYHELPKLADGPLAGYPRVYGIAWAFVAHADSRFDPETLRRFVQAYQRVQPLTIGELWAVPITLRVVLVENLRRMADAITRRRVAQQEADALADDLLAQGGRGVEAFSAMLARDDHSRLVTAFAVELVQRLRGQDPAVTPALAWLHQRLAAQGTTPDEITLVEHQRQAATTVTVRNVITSMRLMSALDWAAFFESVSLVDEALRAGSDFAAMDFHSRDSYRHAIEALARRSHRSELDITRAALAEAAGQPDARRADPGFYLVGGGRRDFERAIGSRPRLSLRLRRAFVDAATPGYLGTLLLFTLLILALPLVPAGRWGMSALGLGVLGLLALVPASDLAVALLNRVVTAVIAPALLPRFEWPAGVPAEFRTLVAVPVLLTGLADVEELIERLEVHYLANSDGDIRFALLSDWSEAATEHAPGDDAILAAAHAGIARLNAVHGPAPGGGDRFFVFHRRRLWNQREGVWMGWERKRGKLHELNRLLRGATDTSFLSTTAIVPSGVRYVVTLDGDTRLPNAAIKRLAGTMAHPLNRPRLDPASRRVTEGYAVLQPRVTPPLPGQAGSRFQRLSSAAAGIDPYAAAVSDVYQDLFGEGSYIGKGIYEIDAFEATLAGRVPENALLSHDLFEGLFARAGLVTDIEFFEAAPVNYLTAAARQHRWARGDWQLLPWILHERLSLIGRWKMIDNLRRSVSMPTAFLTLVIGWAWPGSPAWLWTAFVLAVVAFPPLLSVLVAVPYRPTGVSLRQHLRAVARDVPPALARAGLTLITMTHQAWLMGDAIVRTVTRLYVTHRRMLEWKTMARAASAVPRTLRGFYWRMAGGLVLALAGALATMWARPGAWRVVGPLFAVWALAPALARWISAPGRVGPVTLPPEATRALRLIARRTWKFFTTFVTAESRWLPPDNFQETPHPVVAQRTSPTNIGLYLLASVSARDCGWIGTLDLVDRLEATLQTIQELERHRGHLYNWYDTRDGTPLEPRYISSVDSGNLAGALLTIANACHEIIDHPVPARTKITGIEEAVQLLREAGQAADDGRGAEPGVAKRQRLEDALDVVLTVAAQQPVTPTEWAERLAELDSAARAAANRAREVADGAPEPVRHVVLEEAEGLRVAVASRARDLDTLMPWAHLRVSDAAAPAMARLATATTLSLAELPERCLAALQDLAAPDGSSAHADTPTDALVTSLEGAGAAATALIQRLTRIATDARALVTAMDFGFLFDPARTLFAIGYRMTDGSLDPGHYDLLASEARLLSFIAIAKGDVPVKHWFRLGRPLTPVGHDAVLLSWSGSMFEYLMPRLIMRSPVGSLLEQTCRLVVQRQIDYGVARGVPWGVSESAYYARDVAMTFQYSAFGVPGLGLRRRLADDVVIAPYASGLAAMVEPSAAVDNFHALAAAGAAGRYGFYESLDYTPSRLPADTSHAVVQTYMAHHQGMLIVAIANVLDGGAMRTRFHAEPMVRATELLLQERTPREVAVVRPQVDPPAMVGDVRELVPLQTRTFSTPHGATPRTHLLSNGRYAVMLTAAGSGYSRWRDLAVTRWREDATRDDTGSYMLLRDVDSGKHWSAGYQPSGEEPESYAVSFSEDRAEFLRRDGAIATRLDVIVSSEDDAEVRRVSITNHGARTHEIEVTSYAEIVLAPAEADAAHPAFSKLFVRTESIADRNTLLATRRPRSPEDAEIWLAHVLAVEGETVGDLEWETDRAEFLGRGRSLQTPQVFESTGRILSNTTGPVLDPIISLRRRVRVRPGKTVRMTFSTLVESSRTRVLDLAEKYHDVTAFERAATLAWTQAQVELHHLGIGAEEAHLFQTLGGSILYPDRALRATGDVLVRQAEGTAALWAHGISGDLPIVLVDIDEAHDVGIVRQLLRAHEYWRMKGLAVDLVILNVRAPSYAQDLQGLLETLVRTSDSASRHEGHAGRGKVFLLRADQVTAGQRDALESGARAVLSSRRGTLAAQLARSHRSDPPSAVSRHRPVVATPEPATPVAAGALEFFNGLGGFAAEGREYRIVLRPGQWTPAPWINVLANPSFGCLVSETGAGCTWSINSQLNLLTPWSNDPVTDPPSEMFYIRDDDSGELWSPTPLPIREDDGEYVVHHGQGWTRFEYGAHGIALELLQFVPAENPLKISRLTLTNRSPHSRRLSVTAYLEWVLGTSRSATVPFVITEIDAATGAMFARNSWNRDLGTRIAFADLGGKQTSWTGDRTEFLGRNGTLDRPAALTRDVPLSGQSGPAFDPCCALQTTLHIPPGGSATLVLLLGQTASGDEARALIEEYRSGDLDVRLKAVAEGWDEMLGALQVTTPDRALDLMLNRWLLYQTLVCRLWARTAFYQASGAFGFRDQLQDIMAVTLARPDLARAHLLKTASRQFVEGDVQHWWHEPVGRGVRTRISDDLLWLPYVTSHYVDATGDRAALDELVPFLEGAVLATDQLQSFFAPRVSSQQGTLFEHCARALDRSLNVGAHGLPLMGTGDWNDGMNLVGVEGRGESVWLAWFLISLLTVWAPIAQARGESKRAKAWKRHGAALQEAIERNAWDGEWYRRAFFDDGTPLGSAANDACAIDSIAQSWSVLSGAADPDRAKRAMASVAERLTRDGLLLLLAPPFDNTQLQPGYIKGYLPGVRENGGQYTHAAIWVVFAHAALGDGDTVAELLATLNPISHAATPQQVRQYQIEPYVVAGDVYSEPPHVGRGGWSWYTGSAGWLYRAGVESLLGFRLKGARLELDPCIPRAWTGFTIAFRYRSARYDIVVENPRGVSRGVSALELDGVALDDPNETGIPLADDGQTHRVRAVLG